MDARKLIYGAVAVGLVLLGWLTGNSQILESPPTQSNGEWRLVTTGGIFLYNTEHKAVYRYLNCDEAMGGCLYPVRIHQAPVGSIRFLDDE